MTMVLESSSTAASGGQNAHSHVAGFSGNTDPLLRPKEAAKYLGISERTLWRLIAADKALMITRLTANRIAFRRSDLEAWLASRRSDAATIGTEVA